MNKKKRGKNTKKGQQKCHKKNCQKLRWEKNATKKGRKKWQKTTKKTAQTKIKNSDKKRENSEKSPQKG